MSTDEPARCDEKDGNGLAKTPLRPRETEWFVENKPHCNEGGRGALVG